MKKQVAKFLALFYFVHVLLNQVEGRNPQKSRVKKILKNQSEKLDSIIDHIGSFNSLMASSFVQGKFGT